MNKIEIIDLKFLQEEHSIGAFIVRTFFGPILIETGPMTTFSNLENGIKNLGIEITDIKHVFLTHIHFDHAGAAWKFAEHGAKIYVHPAGLPHLENPEKLWNSAKQIYQDKMEYLWGEMKPISSQQLIAASDQDEFNFGDTTIKVHYTPGHAVHHNSYQIDQVIFTGDVAGVQIDHGPVVPPCPPPDINIELWKESINKLRNLNSNWLYLTHFGAKNNPNKILDELETTLNQWANFIKPFYDTNTPPNEIVPKFMEFTTTNFKSSGLTNSEIQTYEYANPSWMSVNGLLRYWKLKEQGRL
jgi:glyoxylase-like metal-dependent hydrolase (beta-lactamase superfamily II)